MWETRFNPWVGKIPWRQKWQPTPVFLAWKIPWMEKPGRLQSMGSQKVGNDWVTSLSLQVVLVVRNLPINAGDIRDADSIPESGRSPGGGHGNILQYSCLENPMDMRSLAGYGLWGRKEVRQDWSDSTHTRVHAKEACASFLPQTCQWAPKESRTQICYSSLRYCGKTQSPI